MRELSNVVVPDWRVSGEFYLFSLYLRFKQLQRRIKLPAEVLSVPVEMAFHLFDEPFAFQRPADQRSGLVSL